eukprot:2771477-Pyramimonas_sp.AAC.1
MGTGLDANPRPRDPCLRSPDSRSSTTRDPTLRPQDVHGVLVWGRHACHCKTIEAEQTHGTLEASRVFLGM